MQRYNPKDIEPKWQSIWDETNLYTADLQSAKPKYIAMSMFNYPSGAGIHIGHAMNYTISDVKARFKRQQGYESYHPVGWDSFGLPAENYAIKSGVSPQQSMAKIIPSYHTQYKAMGWSNDWEKEIATHRPEYYKWTQWIFTQMYKHGLAYQDVRMQWWCEKDNTVLANEQVIDGKCWRHDGPDDPLVQKRAIKQWFFKITEYADELLRATDALDWTESVKLAQKNWIGKSQGAEITFALDTPENYVLLHGFQGNPTGGFFPWLKEKLGPTASVPALPNSHAPTITEQSDYVLQHETFDENSVLLGHSFGSAVALKVVEKLPTPIKRLVLVAGFAQTGFLDHNRIFEDTNDWQFDWEKIKQHVSEVIVLRDSTDQIVPRDRAEYLAEKLGGRIVDFAATEPHVCGLEEPVVLQATESALTVFTTRPDTLYGATFLVVAPEHPLLDSLTTPEHRQAVQAYRNAALKKEEVERQENKQKTGEFTGSYALSPVTGQKIPIWVADYVLMGYGTGAIMAVPGHDDRDYAFAQAFDLPINFVVEPTFGKAQGDDVQSEKVFVALRNPKTQQVLVLDWGPRQANYGGYMLIGGSVEPGEEHIKAAEREIHEETGYKNVTLVKEAEFKGHGYFHSNTKNINVHASGKGFLFDLVDEEQDGGNLDEGEKDKFSTSWQPIAKVAGMLDDGVHQAFYRYLVLDECYHGEGQMVNSGPYDGLSTSEAREQIVADLTSRGLATEKTNFKMRDWSVGRQRYWGAPIPMIICPRCGPVAVPEADLPVVLPELDDFAPNGDGRSALARATDWLQVDCPECGGPAERETDTLDTYICSSWYMFRYMDPHNQEAIFDSTVVNRWAPIDFYNGGDHATAHLLYARFVTRFFSKIGLLENPEPFKQMLFNGKVTASDGSAFSKSKGNGIDPLEIINSGYGADALRTYLMFAAPLEITAKWDPQGVPGAHRFLSRLWNLVQEYLQAQPGELSDEQAKQLQRITHQTIKKMTNDLELSAYNTAIAAGMTMVNDLYKLKVEALVKGPQWQAALEAIVACVAPFAPHVAEELWHQLGHNTSVQKDSWPQYIEAYATGDEVTIVVQVNGKLRAEFSVAKDASKEDVITQAQGLQKVQTYLRGTEVKKVIYVPGKLVNFVV